MELLRSFSALALIASALLMLLSDGPMRRTASVLIGLVMTLMWVEGLCRHIPLPAPAAPTSVLSASSASLAQAEEDAAALLAQRRSEGGLSP